MSKRKPHNEDAGYVAEKIFRPSGSHIVIYIASEQGIDVGGDKYAVVCSKHASIVSDTNLLGARVSMKYPAFCGDCVAEERSAPNDQVRPPTTHLSKICGEGAHEITADVELPTVILRQGNQSLTLHSEEQLCELMELIEECFTFFDAARQPKAQPSRSNSVLDRSKNDSTNADASE